MIHGLAIHQPQPAAQDPIDKPHPQDHQRHRSDQQAEIIATGIPPTNDLESAIVQNLVPGNYTAIVRGVNNTTGIALVEVYALN